MADWKERLGMVYSTNPDFTYDYGEEQEEATLAPERQKLRVWRDTKGRGGKVATIVRDFVGSTEDLQNLGRLLKQACGVGQNPARQVLHHVCLHQRRSHNRPQT